MSVKSTWSKGFLRELSEEAFRFAYLADQVRTGIAFQIKSMREQQERNWTQGELGEKMDKPQSTVARLENPDYGKVTVSTLLEVANAMDVALLIQFVEWDDFLDRMSDLSSTAMGKRSFDLSQIRESKESSTQVGRDTTLFVNAKDTGKVISLEERRFGALAPKTDLSSKAATEPPQQIKFQFSQ